MAYALSLRKPILSFSGIILYFWAIALVIANILLIYFVHQFNFSGVILGKILLPIYFFTLIAGGRFGWRCGLIVGLVTPIVSNLVSGMPMAPVLYFVIFKSVVLGVVSGLLINRESHKASFLDLVKIVFVYQALGSMFIFVFSHNLTMALMDIYVGWPGLLGQLILGKVVLKILQYEKEEI